MRYKTPLDYIKTLHKADFDPCTLSVQGYADEFKDAKQHFGYDFFSFFFNHTHTMTESMVENFLTLIWVTENLKDALEFDHHIFEICQMKNMALADRALTLFDHASCEDDIDYDYTQLLNLDIKYAYLRDYANSIAGIKK